MLTFILSETVESRVGGNLILEQTNFTNSSAADCYFSVYVAQSQTERKLLQKKDHTKNQMPINLWSVQQS